MTFGLYFFIASILGISFFLVWKAPLLVDLPKKESPEKSLKILLKERAEVVKKETGKRIALNSVLQKALSYLRRFILRIERITTKWLYKLKKKEKNKPE